MNAYGGDSIEQERHELFRMVDRSLIQHKLSAEYFGFRAYWLQYLPLLAITTVTTIIGFLITGMSMGAGSNTTSSSTDSAEANFKGVSEEAHMQQWLSASVGLLGALSTFLTSIGKYFNYQSKYDMHKMAEQALQKISHTLMLEDRSGINNIPKDDDNNQLREEVKKCKAIYISMEDACTSETPHKITQAFNELDGVMKAKHPDFQRLHSQRLYNATWREFAGTRLWPWMIADVNTKSMEDMIDAEYEKFNSDRGNTNMNALTSTTSNSRSVSMDLEGQTSPLLPSHQTSFASAHTGFETAAKGS